jgi:hypothetical protein
MKRLRLAARGRKGEPMIKHYFRTQCPRCGKVDEMTCEGHADPPKLSCGDCLFNDCEVVALTATPLRGLTRYELAWRRAGAF